MVARDGVLVLCTSQILLTFKSFVLKRPILKLFLISKTTGFMRGIVVDMVKYDICKMMRQTLCRLYDLQKTDYSLEELVSVQKCRP